MTSQRPGESLDARILDAVASGVIALDPQRRIVSFNGAAEQTFNVRSTDVLDKEGDALAKFLPELSEMLDTFFSTGATELRAEIQGWRLPDHPLTLEVHIAPLTFPKGNGVAVVVTDRTAQRALEEAHSAQMARASAIEASFSRYLAPHVVRTLMQHPESLSLGGTRQRATMLFADIRGFTQIATALTADRVVDILNRYFEEAVRIVFAREGLLDKFYGDGLLAVFGAPRRRDDDARRAVLAAFDLRIAIEHLNRHLDEPLAISIGLATGDVVAGHLGSAQRMDYTVIGDPVNLASGLQQAAPSGAIYCDAATFDSAALELNAQPREVRVKGRDGAVNAYRLA
ncbi:MAG: PAS domain-containing protein [Candidatus Eremiobacteraeota bacterium]|nr:PAS domain-containing protein [Candidatus Eremiobacteraeota bacterium]